MTTAAAHPYSKVEPLLCSTRCQVVVEHEIEIATGQAIPIDLIKMILEYFSRDDENALPKDDVITRWKVFAFTREDAFFRRALATDLFRFATHGIESTLPQQLGARFDLLERRIDKLYPKKQARYQSSFKPHSVTISALDLARAVTVTHPPSKFDPYQPLDWSRAVTCWSVDRKPTFNTDNNNQVFWERLGLEEQTLTACEYPQPYCPAVGQLDSVILAPFRLNQTSFCPINVHTNGGVEVILLDSFSFISPSPTSCAPADNFSYLPIANAAIKRASKHIVTYALVNHRRTHYFTIKCMVQEQTPPKPATAADAPKKKSECTIQ